MKTKEEILNKAFAEAGIRKAWTQESKQAVFNAMDAWECQKQQVTPMFLSDKVLEELLIRTGSFYDCKSEEEKQQMREAYRKVELESARAIEECGSIEKWYESGRPTNIRTFSWNELEKITKDVMELGMELRQNQLNGTDLRSGNQVLSNYLNTFK